MSELFVGDALDWLKFLPADSVHSWITSPPYYGLRDYGVAGQIGLEETPRAYLARLVAIFEEAKRTLHPTGTLWLNMGDSYASQGGSGRQGQTGQRADRRFTLTREGGTTPPPGTKAKDLLGMPWRLAFALQETGWYLRSDIIWAKPNAMPESVRDRPSKSHEYLFLLTKEPRYFYDGEAVRTKFRPKTFTTTGIKHKAKRKDGTALGDGTGQVKSENWGAWGKERVHNPGGAALRSVWTIPVGRYKGAHFATFPEKLVRPCVLAGTSEKGCCPKCLHPWVRIIERDRRPTRPGVDTKCADGIVGNRDPQRHTTVSTTIGWQSTCDHLLDPIPCTIGDMFAGSGTTLAVAKQLSRAYLGCELKEEYLTLIRQRLESVTPELRFSGNLPAEGKKVVAELRETG